jgi:hypothetical protein
MLITPGLVPLRTIQSRAAMSMDALPPPEQFTTRPARMGASLATP